MTTVPDVSVVVAVYNTMPYLTACLNSLVEQSIGRERLEIIAVDDGSTDASGKELDRFAELYPDTVKVIHQANSGGPARPSNQALERATGRYVFFVGSDDHLGAEALERLVTAADTYDSDVVAGRMVGVNGRYVHQALYRSTNPDVGLADPALSWSLSNCKLFRRDMVERHGLRFREDMPVCSDQPFTIEACVRARRISVLADYDYYYAVRRADSTNITFRTSSLTHLRAAEDLIEFTVGLIEPGPVRDAILRRHFTWELAKLLGTGFPDLGRDEQDKLCAGVRRMADRHLTPEVLDRLDAERRVRVRLAQHGAVEALCAVIRQDDEGIVPPIVIDGGRAYSRYREFRDERLSLPDDCFAFTAGLGRRIADGLTQTRARWESAAGGGTVLTVTVRTTLLGGDAGGLDPAVARVGLTPPRAADDGAPAPIPVEAVATAPLEGGSGTELKITMPVGPLVRRTGSYSLRLYIEAGGRTHDVAVPAADPVAQVRHWRRGRPYRVSVIANGRGRLILAISPIRPLRVVRLRLQRLVNRGAAKQS